MAVRGVRGATVVSENDEKAVWKAARELLLAIMEANPELRPDDIASAIFTVTPDLQAAHPAKAARDLGWNHVPLLCALEIAVPGGLARCLRVLLHWNTDRSADEVRHVYLGEAARLRPEWRWPAD